MLIFAQVSFECEYLHPSESFIFDIKCHSTGNLELIEKSVLHYFTNKNLFFNPKGLAQVVRALVVVAFPSRSKFQIP